MEAPLCALLNMHLRLSTRTLSSMFEDCGICSLLDHMSKVEQPVKMAEGADGPTLHVNLSCWLPLSW